MAPPADAWGRTLGYLVSRMVRTGSDQVVPVDPPVVVDGVDVAVTQIPVKPGRVAGVVTMRAGVVR